MKRIHLLIALVLGTVMAAAIAYASAPVTVIQNYGNEGYILPGDTSSVPPYATVLTVSATEAVWTASTSDVRALLCAGSSGRFAARWNAAQSFEIRINLTDGQPHQVSMYALDWDSSQRAERIDAYDANSGQLKASRTLSNFNGGTYVTWMVSGNVRFVITRTAGSSAVISGLFIDPANKPLITPTPTPTPTPCPGRVLPNGNCQKK